MSVKMKVQAIIKSFKKKHRHLLKALAIEPLEISRARRVWHISQRLRETGLVEYSEHFLSLSATGKEFVQQHGDLLFKGIPDEKAAVFKFLFPNYEKNSSNRERHEFLFLSFLLAAPRKVCEIRNAVIIVSTLLEKKMDHRAKWCYLVN